MAEKDAMLSTDDTGRDLPSVQALQRKHDTIERDLGALEDKVIYDPSLALISVHLLSSILFLLLFKLSIFYCSMVQFE